MTKRFTITAVSLIIVAAGSVTAFGADPAGSGLGEQLPLWTGIPFAGILLSIALFPLAAPKLWHHHYPKISLLWALAFAVPFLVVYRGAAVHEILHIYALDYLPFIILLWGLFTVSGGILIKGSLKGTPAVNTLVLLIGTFLASVIGTTGASMLLIRPIMRSNAGRRHVVHTIVFFIFLVSNIGGSLTPIGDPPLFLGFLHGVPFFWTLKLLPMMGFAVAVILGIYFVIDSYFYRKETIIPDIEDKQPLGLEGSVNFIFLGGIIGAVLFSGIAKLGEIEVAGLHIYVASIIRDAVIVAMGFLSLWATKKTIREANNFNWHPIREVAYLFAGIFMTIIPVLAILKAGEKGALAFLIRNLEQPIHYFWVVGPLSSFLDNAPTYLTYFNSALGRFFPGMAESAAVPVLVSETLVPGMRFTYSDFLLAISAGSVFMGANTYIGNAPNFMVKAIAEEAGIPMPSFFGFMIKYSIPILIPLFIAVSLIFLL